MSQRERDLVAGTAGQLVAAGYHRPEGIVLAEGERLLGPADDCARRIPCHLGGGTGGSHEKACGALTGGLLLLGAV
jgi:hypothetical protein